MKNLTYTVILEQADEGGFNVWVPALPGCVTQGRTHDEALVMARDAISLWLEMLEEQGEDIPEEPSNFGVEIGRVQVTLPKAV